MTSAAFGDLTCLNGPLRRKRHRDGIRLGFQHAASRGRWIAYRSSVLGQMQLYVRPYPGDGGRQLVSIEGGEEPVWSRDSRQLYFRDGTRLMVVDVGDGPTFEASTPRFLFEGFDIQGGGSQNYDITEDGQRFVMVSSDIDGVGGQPSQELNVVLHWTEELKRLVPTE